MKKLKENFRKNGIEYQLLKRTDRYALYKQTISDKFGSEIVGYEVSKLIFNKE